MLNSYKILGVPSNATIREIKKKHRELAKKFHPDRNHNDKVSEEQFKKIQAAYEILNDTEKRMKFDASLREEHSKSQASFQNGGYSTSGYQRQGSDNHKFSWRDVAAVLLLILVAIAFLLNIFSPNDNKQKF